MGARSYILALALCGASVLVSSGCTPDEVPWPTGSITPEEEVFLQEYQVYFEEFVRRAQDSAFALPDIVPHVRFGDSFIPDAAGHCNIEHHVVTIDSSAWRKLDDNGRRHLVFHELGHCILDLHHNYEQLATGQCAMGMGGDKPGEGTCALDRHSPSWVDYYFSTLFAESRAEPPFVETYDADLPVLTVDSFALFSLAEANGRPRVWDSTIVADAPRQVSIRLSGSPQGKTYTTLRVRTSAFWVEYDSNWELSIKTPIDPAPPGGLVSTPYYTVYNYPITIDSTLVVAQNDDVTSFYVDGELLHTSDAVPALTAGQEIFVSSTSGIERPVVLTIQ